MRRLTILLAAVGALMLIPAAQAFAAGTATVKAQGTGSGELTSVGGFFGTLEGEPPIECSYASPGPVTGICATTLSENAFEEGSRGVIVYAEAAPGSEFLKWDKTIVPFQGGGASETCPPEIEFEETPACIATENETDWAYTITATFCLEGQSEEECLAAPPAGPELTVVKEGTGDGTVVSSPAGIECGATCGAQFAENTKVTLTASPDSESLHVSWKGCEKGGVNGRQCTVTMDKAKTVNVKFLTAYDVTVNRVGSGLGKVSSSPGGVLCLSNCSSTTAKFKEGTSVTLNAAPSKNFVFTEWTGDCSGSGPCSLGALGEDKEVGAKFTEVAKHLLTVNKSGGGQGTAKSNLAGINCGATCSTMSSAYYQTQEVELTATPGKGSTFGGWSGAGCSGTGTCKVPMSSAKEVTAEFK